MQISFYDQRLVFWRAIINNVPFLRFDSNAELVTEIMITLDYRIVCDGFESENDLKHGQRRVRLSSEKPFLSGLQLQANGMTDEANVVDFKLELFIAQLGMNGEKTREDL